ncbi:MAG: thioredoxin domain-containing protein [Synechococcaceae cyanobacterium]|nr:thioredoxin domain-containing protein [Synechococcaceae cyanobacterium]
MSAPSPPPAPAPDGAAQAAVSGGASLGRLERMALAAVAALLVLLLWWLRGGLHPAAPLDRLARQSPELATALSDGRATLVEFYADWCEACRAMAPAMERLEQQHRGELDVVLLNVDNPRWQPQLERYDVDGIPQLELFDADGRDQGRSLGARSASELDSLVTALLQRQPLPQLAGVGAISPLEESAAAAAAPAAGPRSHG